MIQRRHLARAVFYQDKVGNVLDLSPRVVASATLPEVSEDKSGLSDGSVIPRRRTHVMQVPVLDDEVVRLAETMAELSTLYGHKVGFVALSRDISLQHFVWAEPSRLQVVPSAQELRDYSKTALQLETRIYWPSIAEGNNLVAGVPWDGASTPGAPSSVDGVTTLPGGEMAVYDDSTTELYLYEDWDGPTYRRFSLPQSLAVPAGMTSLVRDGREEVLVVTASTGDILRIDPADGTHLGTFTLQDDASSSYTPAGLTIAEGQLVALSVSDDLHVYSGVPASGTAVASNTLSVSTETGVSLTYDERSGDLVSVQDVSATTTDQLRRHTAVNASIGDTTGVVGSVPFVLRGRLYLAGSTDVADRGRLGDSGLPLSTVETIDATRRMPLRVRGANGRPEKGYFGPTWTAAHETRVGIDGLPSAVSESDVIVLQMPMPIGGATLRLTGAEAALDGVDFGGTALALSDTSRIGQPAELTLSGGKYSGLGINADTVWGPRVELRDVVERPELLLVEPGTPRGPLRGGYSSTVIVTPKWAGSTVENRAFEWSPDAGQELSIDVTEAPGTDGYIGQISGEGEQVKGTSALFTAENAGSYTAELVAETFEGLTDTLVDADGLDRLSIDGEVANILIWDDPNDTLTPAPEVEFTVSPSEDGQELDLSFLDDSGADVEGIEEIIISQSGAAVDVLDYPSDFPYTFGSAGTYGVTVVGVTEFASVVTFEFGFPGNNDISDPGYDWTHPTDLTSLTGLEAFARGYDSVYDFTAIEVNDTSLIKTVGSSRPANDPGRNEWQGGNLKDDILDAYPNLEDLSFLRWGGFFPDSTVPADVLQGYDLRRIGLGSEARDLFTSAALSGMPKTAREIRTVIFASWGSEAPVEPWFRRWVRIKRWFDQGGTRPGMVKDAWRSRIHLARFAMEYTNSDYENTDPRDGTGSFAHAYDSHDAVAETVTFTGDLRDQSYTLAGDTFQDDAFPDPQDASASGPTGEPLWPDPVDTDHIVRGTADYPGERIFMIDEDLTDDTAQRWMLSTTQAGTVQSGPVTQVTLGSEGTQAKIWKAGENRANVSPGTYDLDSIDWTLDPHLRDGLSGAGLIV